jgi:hypothetical protein
VEIFTIDFVTKILNFGRPVAVEHVFDTATRSISPLKIVQQTTETGRPISVVKSRFA